MAEWMQKKNLDFKVDIRDIDLSALPINDDTVDLDGYAMHMVP